MRGPDQLLEKIQQEFIIKSLVKSDFSIESKHTKRLTTKSNGHLGEDTTPATLVPLNDKNIYCLLIFEMPHLQYKLQRPKVLLQLKGQMYQVFPRDWDNQSCQFPTQLSPVDSWEEESSSFEQSSTGFFISHVPSLWPISTIHKQEISPSSNIQLSQDGASTTTTDLSGNLPPTSPSDQDEEDGDEGKPTEPQRKKTSKKAYKKRKDDNNNAHKKFITVQNAVLNELKMLKQIKRELKDAGMKFDKGSRHSFVTRMIETKVLFGEGFSSFKTKFISKIAKKFKPSDKPAQAYLHLLVRNYTQSCELFAEGKEKEATKILYDLPDAKEEKYKEEGIQKVLKYRKQRFQ